MKKMRNNVKVQGRLYDHELELKTVQNKNSENYGKEFIRGRVFIATDEEGVNVVELYYTYEPEMTKSGKKNRRFKDLLDIISNNPSWSAIGKDNALKVEALGTVGLNDFYNQEEELVSARRIEGGLINKVAELNEDVESRTEVKIDMVITNFTKDEESEAPKGTFRGAVFNFRGDLLPLSLTMTDPKGIEWMEKRGFEPSTPVLAEVTGILISENREIQIEKENAWGGTIVETRRQRHRDWVAISLEDHGDVSEDSEDMTLDELKTAMQNRQIYLAEVKKRQDEWKANREVIQAESNSTVKDVVNNTPKKNTEFDF